MLKEIYDYGVKAKIASSIGFKLKNVKAYILLNNAGEFIAIDAGPKEKQLCPDIGSLAQGTDKCNILVEKAEIVFALSEKSLTKHNFYISALKKGSKFDTLFSICLKALQDKTLKEAIVKEFYDQKYNGATVIGFKVDGLPVEQSESYLCWWDEFRKSIQPFTLDKGDEKRCFITGEKCKPIKTVPKINGLFPTGGHSSGDSLICFDKDSFKSYNLDQAENCTVSEHAITKVNFALEKLMAEAPIQAGTKFIHWYKEPLPLDNDYDLLELIDNPNTLEEDDRSDDENASREITALINAKRLIESIKNGENPQQLYNRYYALSLSGAGGRVMIRSYLEGSYEELYESFKSWFEDLRIINAVRPPKLSGIYSRLLKQQKSSGDIGKRMAQELAGIDNQIKFSIIKNTKLPDTVAAKALNYIRSDIFNSEEERAFRTLDKLACSILKAWLIRKEMYDKHIKKEEVSMKEYLNDQNHNSAYLAGRMMAVYAKIQEEASGDVGANVIQRFYTAASTSPALVIGRLSTLSQYHLSKLNKGANIYFTNILANISSMVEFGFPKSMNLEQQSQFALGYYQQIADIYKKKTSIKENKED
jgi:CRISPR-associated protein Csd1